MSGGFGNKKMKEATGMYLDGLDKTYKLLKKLPMWDKDCNCYDNDDNDKFYERYIVMPNYWTEGMLEYCTICGGWIAQ